MLANSGSVRILIKGGKVVNDDCTHEADVYIENGIIQQVGRELMIPGGAKVIDATGKLVIPGGIDTSTHFHQTFMNATCVDDFYHGTKVMFLFAEGSSMGSQIPAWVLECLYLLEFAGPVFSPPVCIPLTSSVSEKLAMIDVSLNGSPAGSVPLCGPRDSLSPVPGPSGHRDSLPLTQNQHQQDIYSFLQEKPNPRRVLGPA
uniref:Dihydropyrimidinase like 5 n=1 Tax=Felis catus TaxID=9685 RepID=A0ABI7XGK2_FELCA